MKRYFVFVLLIAIAAVGCGPSPDEIAGQTAAAETQIAEAWTATPTAVPSPTLTPTNTVTPSPTPTFPPLPNFLTLSIADQPVLSSSDDPSCQLPCWQGLTPGESTLADIQRVAGEVLGYDENRINSLPENLLEGLPLNIEAFPGIYHHRVGWTLDPLVEESGRVTVAFVVDEARILQGLEILQRPKGEYPVSSPQEMIKVLGSPDYVDVSITHGIDWTGKLAMHLVYEKGISYQFHLEAAPQSIYEDRSSATYAPICLNEPPSFTVTDLVPPLENLTGENSTVTQQEWILDQIGQGRWTPIEEQPQLEMSIDEFVEFILQPEPCLEIDFAAAPFA